MGIDTIISVGCSTSGCVRQTAVDAKLNVHKTGKPYTMTTNVRELLEGFLRRCREEGIFLLCKEGRPLSIARAWRRS